MEKYLEITSETKIFAQNGPMFLLTNEQEWDYETVDQKTFMVCFIDTRYKEITPYVPLWMFTNHDPYWMRPIQQFRAEELESIKNYTRV